MKLSSLPAYLRSASRFARSGRSLSDLPSAALLGLARRSPFDGTTCLNRIAQRLFRKIRVHPRLLSGLAVEVDTSDLGQLICYEEVLMENVYNLDLVPFVPELIVDCGAHIGLFSMLALARFPKARLMAFEPNPKNAAQLRRNLAPFGDLAQIHEAAVSVESGESWFASGESNTGRLASGGAGEGWLVQLESLPQHITRMGHRAMLLKLDVEGEELTIVPEIAPLLPPSCGVFFETHDGKSAWDRVSAAFEGSGFQVSCLRDRDIYREGFASRCKADAQSFANSP